MYPSLTNQAFAETQNTRHPKGRAGISREAVFVKRQLIKYIIESSYCSPHHESTLKGQVSHSTCDKQRMLPGIKVPTRL